MNRIRTRGSASTILVGVIVIVALIGGGLYLFSDVFKTKADRAFKDLTQWTPENIAADPLAYLDFCETKANDAMKKLKASEIEVKTNLNELKAKQAESASAIETGDKALTDLKSQYTGAEQSQTWPLKWQGKEFDQAQAKKQIVSLHKSLEGKKRLLDTLNSGVKKLENQIEQIKDAKFKCEEQLASIATNRDMLKVKSITDDLKKQLVDMKSVLTVVVDTADDKDSLVSLDELTRDPGLNVSDTEFEKIMAK
jgi:DNA repair exonuclease SbcCD ATPase subunit